MTELEQADDATTWLARIRAAQQAVEQAQSAFIAASKTAGDRRKDLAEATRNLRETIAQATGASTPHLPFGGQP